MANNFNLTLDTTAPASPAISIESGAAYAAAQLVNVGLSTGDGTTVGYTMKIWGDVDGANDANVQPLETNSAWITFAATKQIKLSATDGTKTVYFKIRDDVYNPSSQASDTIILDTSVPVVTINSGPDVSKISKIATKDTCAFTFICDTAFEEYKVKVVSTAGSTHTTGTQIPTASGSTNMAGSAGGYAAGTPISCSIKGTDLETASAGDAVKIIKVFVRDAGSNWSV